MVCMWHITLPQTASPTLGYPCVWCFLARISLQIPRYDLPFLIYIWSQFSTVWIHIQTPTIWTYPSIFLPDLLPFFGLDVFQSQECEHVCYEEPAHTCCCCVNMGHDLWRFWKVAYETAEIWLHQGADWPMTQTSHGCIAMSRLMQELELGWWNLVWEPGPQCWFQAAGPWPGVGASLAYSNHTVWEMTKTMSLCA